MCGEVRLLLREHDGTEEGADPEMAAQISQLHVHGIGNPTPKEAAKDDRKLSAHDNESASAAPDGLDSDEANRSPDPAELTVASAPVSVAPTRPELPPPARAQHAVARRAQGVQDRNQGPDYVDYLLQAILGLLAVVIFSLIIFKSSRLFEKHDDL